MRFPLSLVVVAAISLWPCHLLSRVEKNGLTTDVQSSSAAVKSATDPSSAVSSEFILPGPLRPFLRMAGISQKITPEEVLPLLSRNVFTQGYAGSARPTEFLLLLRRYVVQARELTELAGGSAVLRVANCDDARPLLRVLGYRIPKNCGTEAARLQTEDPDRAFLSTNSGFPLLELEEALQGGKPFEYAYVSCPVPVLFAESDWTLASSKNDKESSKDLLNTILNDPAAARLYWALSNLDPETARSLRGFIGMQRLLPYSAVLDFYGSRIFINAGRVRVPGGLNAEAAWKDLVGVSPESPGAFVERLVAKDKGWLAAYFDVLSRLTGDQLTYFTEPRRLRLFYEALRGPRISESATSGSFRPAPALLLLGTRLKFETTGEPLVPGDLALWKEVFLHGRNSGFARKMSARSLKFETPDELVQAMFALSRAPTDHGPVQIFMTISELDSRRAVGHRLLPATVLLLSRKFDAFSDQYRIFSEFPELSDDSITEFFEVAQALNDLPAALRGNALGIFQANVGIWQILARQGEIPRMQLEDSWQRMVKPFATTSSATRLYDAGRSSLSEIFRVATGNSGGFQDDLVDLLAGPRQTTPEGMQMHREVAFRIRSVLTDQRLISLDTLAALGDALVKKSQGKPPAESLIRLARQTREFEMPQPIFSSGEHQQWAAGIYNNRHAEEEMHADLARILRADDASTQQMEAAHALLASFLRDTLVGLNYAYYEPPGAQALHSNPLFVRSHDFTGETLPGLKTLWQAPELIGQGSPAGGGAHFVGSLADLPYSLAALEQNFIAPDNVQALSWKELTPELLAGAILPRWWNVSAAELHAIALYQRSGEELLAASANDETLHGQVMSILSERLPPRRSRQLKQYLEGGRLAEMLEQIMPADTFYLAVEFAQKYPERSFALGTATRELQDMGQQHPEQVNWKRLSHDFGTPHPTLVQNYGLELLNVAPMPPFAGYSSRFLAESWDSPSLYWARLADEGGYSPVMLNHLVPELTRLMVEKIFATDFDDWPALLRAMRETGEDFRHGKLDSPTRMSEVRP